VAWGDEAAANNVGAIFGVDDTTIIDIASMDTGGGSDGGMGALAARTHRIGSSGGAGAGSGGSLISITHTAVPFHLSLVAAATLAEALTSAVGIMWSTPRLTTAAVAAKEGPSSTGSARASGSSGSDGVVVDGLDTVALDACVRATSEAVQGILKGMAASLYHRDPIAGTLDPNIFSAEVWGRSGPASARLLASLRDLNIPAPPRAEIDPGLAACADMTETLIRLMPFIVLSRLQAKAYAVINDIADVVERRADALQRDAVAAAGKAATPASVGSAASGTGTVDAVGSATSGTGSSGTPRNSSNSNNNKAAGSLPLYHAALLFRLVDDLSFAYGSLMVSHRQCVDLDALLKVHAGAKTRLATLMRMVRRSCQAVPVPVLQRVFERKGKPHRGHRSGQDAAGSSDASAATDTGFPFDAEASTASGFLQAELLSLMERSLLLVPLAPPVGQFVGRKSLAFRYLLPSKEAPFLARNRRMPFFALDAEAFLDYFLATKHAESEPSSLAMESLAKTRGGGFNSFLPAPLAAELAPLVFLRSGLARETQWSALINAAEESFAAFVARSDGKVIPSSLNLLLALYRQASEAVQLRKRRLDSRAVARFLRGSSPREAHFLMPALYAPSTLDRPDELAFIRCTAALLLRLPRIGETMDVRMLAEILFLFAATNLHASTLKRLVWYQQQQAATLGFIFQENMRMASLHHVEQVLGSLENRMCADQLASKFCAAITTTAAQGSAAALDKFCQGWSERAELAADIVELPAPARKDAWRPHAAAPLVSTTDWHDRMRTMLTTIFRREADAIPYINRGLQASLMYLDVRFTDSIGTLLALVSISRKLSAIAASTGDSEPQVRALQRRIHMVSDRGVRTIFDLTSQLKGANMLPSSTLDGISDFFLKQSAALLAQLPPRD
jgi:hypothetical protein